jgi:hypothetical protein
MTVLNESSSQTTGSGVGALTIHTAVLDKAHLGDIHGALGSIAEDDFAPRTTLGARLKTLLAILGPGLIVMVGDNDAGAFGTYTQAGQNYGTTLLWTLVLLIPVLYVNQEMVLRLGAVTGVGHARLIFERFGKFWGAFSVIDLFLLNALTRGIPKGLDAFNQLVDVGLGNILKPKTLVGVRHCLKLSWCLCCMFFVPRVVHDPGSLIR